MMPTFTRPCRCCGTLVIVEQTISTIPIIVFCPSCFILSVKSDQGKDVNDE